MARSVAYSSNDAGLFLDGIPATRAVFLPVGIAVQPGPENRLISDALSNRIRSVSR